MTNAEAAAFFASKPPDGTAEIAFINGDTGFLSFHDLNTTDDSIIEELDEPDAADVANALDCLHIYFKW